MFRFLFYCLSRLFFGLFFIQLVSSWSKFQNLTRSCENIDRCDVFSALTETCFLVVEALSIAAKNSYELVNFILFVGKHMVLFVGNRTMKDELKVFSAFGDMVANGTMVF